MSNNKQKNDTSKSLTKDLAERSLRVENETLSKQCAQLSITLEKALTSLTEKEQEIAHLKELLSSIPVEQRGSVVEIMTISEEEEIAQVQLELLKVKARSRELTLEEVKKFDLLAKNKNLYKPTKSADTSGLPKSVGKSKLIQIAGRKRDERDDE